MAVEEALLRVRDLSVSYGGIEAVKGISLDVYPGEVVALIGANGAGKSTTLRAISGLKPYKGEILFEGSDLRVLPAHRIVDKGIGHVPEGRGIFGNLTVMENLRLATWQRKDKKTIEEDLAWVFTLFPRLQERRGQAGGTLSGGEQQMLAIGRALMSRGRMLLLDEPSMGLAPKIVQDIFSLLQAINDRGMTILLVEQNANQALHLAARAYVMETGRIVLAGPATELLGNPLVKEAYLGG